MVVIAFSGNRCVGKDTAYELLSKIIKCKRFAFADALKKDLQDLIYSQFEVDIFNPNKTQKELIRPIMIAYGCVWREKDPNHWVKIVINNINKDLVTPNFVIVDVRFENELDELEKNFGKDLVHVNISNKFAPPPTSEEKTHYKNVARRAHYFINWGNNTLDERQQIISNLYRYIQMRKM